MLIKVIGVGFLTVYVALILKKDRPELSSLVSVCGGILILLLIFSSLNELVQTCLDFSSKNTLTANLITPILKVIGIGYLVEFSSSLCEESGLKSISNKIILAGKVIILLVCMPLIKSLFELLLGLL